MLAPPAPALVSEPRAAVYWSCLGAGPLLQLLASLLLPAILPPAISRRRRAADLNRGAARRPQPLALLRYLSAVQ